MTPKTYNQINSLIADYSDIFAMLESSEAAIKIAQLNSARELLPVHAELKIKLTELETKLRQLADENYAELFPAEDEKRSHATPFGALKYHKSTSLEYDDLEKVMLKIDVACEKERLRVVNDDVPFMRFTREQLVRRREEPDLEAMSDFDDATLASFGIRREHKDNFKVSPFAMKTDKPKKKEAA